MKIIQVNIWMGQLLPFVIDLLQEEQPDIVCVQEAYQADGTITPAFADTLHCIDRIKAATNLKYHYYAPIWKTSLSQGSLSWGSCIFSTRPFTRQENQFVTGGYFDNLHPNTFEQNACNVLMVTVEDEQNQDWHIANTHGYHDVNPLGNDQSLEAAARTIETIDAYTTGQPVILCGDFNVTTESATIRHYNERFENLILTQSVITTLSPAHRIKEIRDSTVCDYIFVTPNSFSIKRFEVSERLVSDHRALITELEYKS